MTEFLIGNIKGPKGETGQGFKVLGYFETAEDLWSGVASPSVGDAYGVGRSAPYDIYIYSDINGWVNNGALQGAKGDTGPQGEKGDTGANAVITGVTATVDENTGTPSVTVSMGGTESERTFDFAFSGLKGESGSGDSRIETGSYVGTGLNMVNTGEEYTDEGSNTLTFSFQPKLVIIRPVTQADWLGDVFVYGQRHSFTNPVSLPTEGAVNVLNWGSNGVSWGCLANSEAQYNSLGMTYYYIAIGQEV